MAENSTNTPNNEEKRWYEKISWNYVLGGLLLLFALMYFSQNGCNTTKKTSSEDEEQIANSPFTQLRKSMKKVRAEEKRREAALNDVNNFYDDVVDPEVNGNTTKKTSDGNCHDKNCDGTCGLHHSVIDNSTNQTVIVNTGGVSTKPAYTSKKSSGGGYKKPDSPKTEPAPKPDVKSDTNWKNCIIRIWNPDRTKCKDFPYTKAGRREALSFIKDHNLNYDSLPSEEGLPD